MKVEEIKSKLLEYKNDGKKIFATSSFQTHSIPLLHILSTSGVDIDILFINTGFHFSETLSFRDEVTELLGLHVIDVKSVIPKIQQKSSDGQFYFLTDPDYCCYLNKTQPLEPYLMTYDIWISGVRADQSSVRKNMQTEQPSLFDTTRFHPMLDWSIQQVYAYKKEYNLPEHPLDAKGYQSIGCAPCTRKLDLTDERSARWFGMSKTECGLHTELISK